MAADPDIARCRAQLHAGSKSFAAASRLLPRSLRDDATVLYAFCREADDLVDMQQGHPAAIAALRERVDRIMVGRPLDRPCDRAMAGLVARHRLPRLPLDALIEGFEWDVQGRRYETLADLEAYAARVAGTVGTMIAVLMGTRTPSAIAHACELGLAMQLSNIARDVGEDARAGRLYLPAAWLREAGIDPDAWLARPVHSVALGGVVQRLLSAADRLYAGIEPGIAQLPAGCRPGIRAAQRVYAEIGREIARAGHDSVTQRAVVPARRKLQLLARALLPVATARAIQPPHPARASIRFLVESVAQGGERLPLAIDPRGATIPWWQFRARALWLIDLFARLETERRAAPRGLGLGGH